MENIQNINDISKETLTFLAFFDKEMIAKIPTYIITELCEKAADSNIEFYIDKSKSFQEQNISEKCKDLLAYIYYDYIADENEKKEILKQWNINELEYRKTQEEKYHNIFKKKEKNIQSVELTEIKKENLLHRIKRVFEMFFKKH